MLGPVRPAAALRDCVVPTDRSHSLLVKTALNKLFLLSLLLLLHVFSAFHLLFSSIDADGAIINIGSVKSIS